MHPFLAVYIWSALLPTLMLGGPFPPPSESGDT